MKNERGNSLITVLLVSLVFTIIGLAIISSTISGAKKTETRESDISITYDSIKLIDKMTSDLAELLNGFSLDPYRLTGSDSKLEVSNSFDIQLREKLKNELVSANKDNPALTCINIIDLSNSTPLYIEEMNECAGSLIDYAHFEIEKDKDFTRVFDIVLVTKNPSEIEGQITRTITKRLILSPLPSFLKYAAGSDEDLILNGSANFRGNVYANDLTINKNAEYKLRDNTPREISTPMSSINGDLYSQTANLLTILEKENFYNDEVPKLKHDSQFINIEFDKTMNESTNDVLANSELTTKRNGVGKAFSQDLKEDIGNLKSPTGTINNCKEEEEEKQEEGKQINSASSETSAEGNCIKSDKESFGPTSLGIQGSLVVTSTIYPITLLDLAVDGDLFLESNAGISIEGNVYVEGDLYVVSNQNINITGDVYVSGKIHLINFSGKLELENNLISADTITAESHATNKDYLASSGLKLKGNIVSGKDVVIKPINTSIEISKNIFANHTIDIMGNDELDSGASKEDDEVIFDSVVYAGAHAYISNTNISGPNNNERQLILLAKEDLLLTRINEFNNFEPLNEDGSPPYLPLNEKNIKPLKGFFYTEKNAELYGVGSLFYIEGGIFAKKMLTINAVRGGVKNLPPNQIQQDRFSRFIVDYDQAVLLRRMEALPVMNQLQIFSDELIVK